jgi:hypothetical protein
VRAALASYIPGYDSASIVELPKLELADALLAAMAARRARPQCLADVLRPTPAVVEVTLRPKRRRA